MHRRTITAVGAAFALSLALAAPALADHSHVRVLGNGECVNLAPGSGEARVQLPFATDFAENRRHPLHVLVHLGKAGTTPDGMPRVFVAGSPGALAACDGYVNDGATGR